MFTFSFPVSFAAAAGLQGGNPLTGDKAAAWLQAIGHDGELLKFHGEPFDGFCQITQSRGLCTLVELSLTERGALRLALRLALDTVADCTDLDNLYGADGWQSMTIARARHLLED